MNIGAFAVVQLIARHGDRRTAVEDYNGIGFESPVLAFSLSLFMLSLLGMPLTAGFMGKIMVFGAAVNQRYYALVVIGVLNTAISAYYYLRLIIVMFFRERTTTWTAPKIPASMAVALTLTIVGVLYLGLFPGRVINALQTRIEAQLFTTKLSDHQQSSLHTIQYPSLSLPVAVEELAKQIQSELGESWLPLIYRDRVLKLRTRSYHFENLKPSEKVGDPAHAPGRGTESWSPAIFCPDLATARYLSVFARAGCKDVASAVRHY